MDMWYTYLMGWMLLLSHEPAVSKNRVKLGESATDLILRPLSIGLAKEGALLERTQKIRIHECHV